jgi:hypothetical protein
VKNLSRIGGSNALASALSSGLYRYFDQYYYSRMGVHASLKSGWLELHGIPIGDKEYLIVRAFRVPTISMPIQFLTPEPRIRFKGWLKDLASIGSGS